MINASELLIRCSEAMGRKLAAADLEALSQWNKDMARKARELTERLAHGDAAGWTDAILNHRSHAHAWYDQLARYADADCIVTWMLENRYFPPFVPMLERVREEQFCDQGRRAVDDNIADEQVPTPHGQMIARMFEATKKKASPHLEISLYPSLIDQTLAFYYGYYCDPWHLVGSLFVTELKAVRRVKHLGMGLRRLGVPESELEFIAIHEACDEDHARDWQDKLILPSIALKPELKRTIAAGIAACLESSALYQDDLLQRATAQGRRSCCP